MRARAEESGHVGIKASGGGATPAMSRLRLLREGWPSWLPMQPTGLMPPPSIAWQSFLHGQPENGKRNIQWAHKKAYRHLEFPAKQLTNRAALAHCVAVDTWAGSRGPLSFWHGSLASLCLCCGLLCVVFRAARFRSCAERPSHILTLSVPLLFDAKLCHSQLPKQRERRSARAAGLHPKLSHRPESKTWKILG